MILMIAAIAQQRHTVSFILPYWPLVDTWCEYLVENGAVLIDLLSH